MAEIFNLKEINNVSTKDIITDYDDKTITGYEVVI